LGDFSPGHLVTLFATHDPFSDSSHVFDAAAAAAADDDATSTSTSNAASASAVAPASTSVFGRFFTSGSVSYNTLAESQNSDMNHLVEIL
jgi:hypothetical protein